MKHKALVGGLIILFEILSQVAFGQPEIARAKSEVQKHMQHIENCLKENTLELCRTATRELGSAGDRTAIPLLQEVLRRSSDQGVSDVAEAAQMALAKLGDKQQFDEIAKELDNDDAAVQYQTIEKLVYVGDMRAVNAIAQCLYDTKHAKYRSSKAYLEAVQQGKRPMDRVVYPPLSHMVIYGLAKLVPDGPRLPDRGSLTDEDVAKWRQWWEQNKHKYQ